MTRRVSSTDERGQAIVEFALVGMVFFFLVFGVLEVSRALFTYNTLVQQTRAAARWAVVNVANNSDPKIDNAKNVAVYGNPAGSGAQLLTGLTTSNVSISIEDLERDSNNVAITQKVSVSITGYQFQFVVPFIPNVTIPAFETSLYTESMGATS
jgi:Flp pilus assembly protein TadG